MSQASQDMLVLLLTNRKKNGWYVEIGASHPIQLSNTFLLEKEYGWRGLMVEICSTFLQDYQIHRPLAFHIIMDATQVDYEKVLGQYGFPSYIDYLQIDLDVDNRSTLDTLELMERTVFDKHVFGVVTFEHDIYRGDFFNTRARSREIFEKHGYIRIFSDVCVNVSSTTDWYPFEDWYAHPLLVDPQLIQKIVNHPDHKNNLPHIKCIDIIQQSKEMGGGDKK